MSYGVCFDEEVNLAPETSVVCLEHKHELFVFPVSRLPRTGTGVLHDGDRLQPARTDDGQLESQVRQEVRLRVFALVVLKQGRMQDSVRFFKI